ncbi:Fanconi anemia group M protein [Merluccius polli]|uniref:Fanconi anemia group M protein n=1 Tax=Merluccius polli TaxID=89951 RepID=A0AA47PAL8_MERPO|nr:Fanconi anemia group M protein [Merluccius polli]
MSANQRTLFQTWGGSAPQRNTPLPPKGNAKKTVKRRKTDNTVGTAQTQQQPPRSSLWGQVGQGSGSANPPSRIEDPPDPDDHEVDDDVLLVAVYEAEKSLRTEAAVAQDDDDMVAAMAASSSSSSQLHPDLPGFDGSSAGVWIYPTNYPVREYQLRISEAALFRNTLVCLPTGLGKTFIASVVMYNFYRWYPSGKIVFMAPTKPLVAQQIEACYKVMGIPQTHMAELTGSTAAGQRQELWRSRRVFFLTPQVMVNDLSRDTCPALQVRCVVIDEAHKALGNQAYCQVVRQLCSQTRHFRILALSATPGGDSKAVQQVISNLLISHIELRSEESPDIQAHSHQRILEKVVVPLGETLSAHQARYLQRDARGSGCNFNISLTHLTFRTHAELQSWISPFHEPDLVLAVSVSGVGVARHDEGIVDTHTWRVQNLGHGVDLIHDGHFVGGSNERPER